MLFYLMAYVGLRARIAFMLNEIRAKKRFEVGREQGRKVGLEIGRAEGTAAVQKDWLQWLEQIKDKPREEWPPPPGSDNGASNGAGENGKA